MMSKLSRFTLVSLFALAFASYGVAYAQDEEPAAGEGEGDEGGEAAPAEGTEGDEGGEAAAVAGGAEASAEMTGAVAGVGPFTKETYPQESVNRPLTLPKGMVEASGLVNYAKVSVAGASASATGLGVTANYGVSDKLQAGVSTGLGIDPEVAWSKSIGLGGGFLAIDQEKLDVAAQLALPLDFNEGADIVSKISLGAAARYMVSPKLAIYTGHGLINVQFAGGTAAAANLNVGAGFQATKELAVRIDTNLAHLKITGDLEANAIIGKDVIPLGATILYALSNKLDIVVQLAFPDLKNAKADVMTAGGGVAFRM